MHDGRTRRLARACAGITLALSTTAATFGIASPAAAEPDQQDVDQAQSRADHFYREAEVASERYNAAKARLDDTQQRLAKVNKKMRHQRNTIHQMRDSVVAAAGNRYATKALSTAGQVVLSDDADAFVENLTALDSYNRGRGLAMQNYASQLRTLEQSKQDARRQLQSVRKQKRKLAAHKAEMDAKAGKAEDVLAGLKDKVREQQASNQASNAAPAAAPASGGASSVVQYALAQVGDTYVYGATGPDAFDCSGLTMAAWAQAGVSLPHSSSGQYSSGTRVSESQLQPGDLVFYYSPISHVGIYIGNGQIVHAANPSTDVAVTSLHSMPFTGAVRPGS